MFLLRMTFWIVVVILLIPATPESTTRVSATVPEVTVDGAIGAAAATVSDMAGFCDRNHGVCETGEAAFALFLAKAENGARLLYRAVSGEPGTEDAATLPARDTLRSEDRIPAWRGPAGDQDA